MSALSVCSLALLIWSIAQQTEVQWIALANLGMCFMVIWAIAHAYETGRDLAFDLLGRLAVKDQLTGVYNRMLLAESFEKARDDSLAQEKACAVMILDADHFKRVNDTYGHDVGDRVLVAITETIKRVKQQQETLFRLGGEEFGLLLPCCSREEAVRRAEAVRKAVESRESINPILPAVTLSVGVAIAPDDGVTMSEVFKAADEKLYFAKERGRNCVVA